MIVTPAVGLFPGTNPVIALILLWILSVFWSINFGWLGMAMPRSGGEYVFNTRGLHPSIGFMGDFIFNINNALAAATIFNLLISWTFSWLLSSLGLADAASAVTKPVLLFTLATMAVIMSGVLNLYPKGVGWYLKITIGLSVVGAAVLLPVLFAGYGRFPALFTKATGVDYNSIIPLAIKNGFNTGHDWSATALTLAWLGPFWLGWGGVYIAGEVKNVQKSMLWATIMANPVFGMIPYILFVGGTYLVTDYTWYNAFSWLYDKGVNPTSIDPSVVSLVNIIAPYPWIGPVVAFTMLASMATLAPALFIWISRSTFMWAFDRLLPEKYTDVSERFHVPVTAILFSGVIIEIALAVSVFSGVFTVWLNTSWLAALTILLTSLTAMLLPYQAKTKKIFESAPAIVKAKIGGVPVISIGGAGTFAFMAFFFISAILYPSINPLSPTQMMSIPIACIIGLVYYYIVKYYRLRQGIDITLAYKELPPE